MLILRSELDAPSYKMLVLRDTKRTDIGCQQLTVIPISGLNDDIAQSTSPGRSHRRIVNGRPTFEPKRWTNCLPSPSPHS